MAGSGGLGMNQLRGTDDDRLGRQGTVASSIAGSGDELVLGSADPDQLFGGAGVATPWLWQADGAGGYSGVVAVHSAPALGADQLFQDHPATAANLASPGRPSACRKTGALAA